MGQMTKFSPKHNDDISLYRSTPRQESRHSFMGEEDEETEIWRISWSRRVSAQNSFPETEIFSTRSSFERRLFRLLLEAEGEATGRRDSSKFRWWNELFKKREQQAGEELEESSGRVDGVRRVEKLTSRGWQLYSFGMSAPELFYVPQEDA